jgi:hypothetical protein
VLPVVLGMLDTNNVNLGQFSVLFLQKAHSVLDTIEALTQQHREQLAK